MKRKFKQFHQYQKNEQSPSHESGKYSVRYMCVRGIDFASFYGSGVDFTKSRKSKINRKCYRKCDFQAFDWLKFTPTTDLRLTTFCEIDH